MTTDVEYYRGLLERAFAGRRFLLFGEVLAGLTETIRDLRALGAERPFALAPAAGIGALPDTEAACTRILPVSAGTHEAVESIWASEAAVRELPDDAVREIEAWDPERSARALVRFTLSPVPEVACRRRYADRPPSWAQLEDKTELPAFLDAIGVRRGPLAVVRAEPACLRDAAARLDRGRGTVWSGDAAPGVHGGGYAVRWVHDDDTREQAEAFFAGRFGRVRVSPFYEGIPCSIHGIVFAEGVAVFRPMEMIVLRRRGSSRFVYGGSASFWDPEPEEREEMRLLARQIGCGLRDRLAYRGAFALDGVLSDAGFVPTELNTRIGAAFRHLHERSPELPLSLLALAVQEGERFDWRPSDLERLVLERADERRSGSARMRLPKPCSGPRGFAVAGSGEKLRRARRGGRAQGRLWLGPAVGGSSFLVYAPDPSRAPIGPSFAPAAAAAFRLADRAFGTEIGLLSPASPAGVRRATMAGTREEVT
jgi:hypothetical protein